MGASTASRRVSARRAASPATSSGSCPRSSKPACPPRVSVPVSTRSPRRATTWALRRTRAVVGDRAALRVEYLDLAPRLGVTQPDLGDLRPGRTGSLLARPEQVGLACGLHPLGRERNWMSVRGRDRAEPGRRASPRTAWATEPATRIRSARPLRPRARSRWTRPARPGRRRRARASCGRSTRPSSSDGQAVTRLRVELGEVAAALERLAEHLPRQSRLHQCHSPSPASRFGRRRLPVSSAGSGVAAKPTISSASSRMAA